MKKLISLLLIFLMAFSMTTSAFAATGVFYDKATDSVLDYADNAESIYADLKFVSPIDGDAQVFAATYDENGKFLKIQLIDKIAVTTGEEVEYTTPGITLDGAHTLKLFVWDSLDSTTTLCKPAEICLYEEYVTLSYKNCDGASETEYAAGTEIILPDPVKNSKTGTYTFVEWVDGADSYGAGETFTIKKDTILIAKWSFEGIEATTLSFDDLSKVTAGPYNSETGTYDDTVASVTAGISETVHVNANTPKHGDTGIFLDRNFVYATLDLRNEPLAKNVMLNLTGVLSGSKTSNIYVEKVSGYPVVGEKIESGEKIATFTYSSETSDTPQSVDITEFYNKSVGKVIYLKMYGWYGYAERFINALQIKADTVNLSYTPSDGQDFVISFNEGAEGFVAAIGEAITLPECTTVIAGRKFAGWSDGNKVYSAGAKYSPRSDVVFTATYDADPTTYTEAQKALDGKKIMFIGNSYVYYGNCVVYPGRTAWTWDDRNGDIGYFYQLCRLNNIDVTVTNWCFSGHTTANTFNGPCDHNIECAGVVHEDHIEDKYYDYVVISPHADSTEQAAIEENLDYIFNFFREENPNVKFVLLGNHAIYGVTYKGTVYNGIINHFETIKSEDIMVANWGKIWKDILDGTTQVPGAEYEYDMNTFVLTNDGHHENTLGGYITALATYRAITKDSVVGQPYEFCSDATIHSKFDQEEYRNDYYVGYEDQTNFVEILQSENDIRGLQQLVDEYIETEYVAPEDPVKVTLKDCDEAGETEYEKGTELTLTTPTKSGKTNAYIFKEWTDGENTYKAGDVITLAEDITLTAVWEAEALATSEFGFDELNLLTVGVYDEATQTYDNTVKSVNADANGILSINARNPYNSTDGVYMNRPYLYASVDLTNEAEAESVMLNVTGMSKGYGSIYVYQVEEIPGVGEEMTEGTLACTVSVTQDNTGTAQSFDITDIYNASLGKTLYLRIYGWYGGDKRYTNHMTLDSDALTLSFTAKVPVIPVTLTLEGCDEAGTAEYNSGDEVTLVAPTKSAQTGTYTFEGWTDGENTYNAGDVITLTEDVTLTATWNFTAFESATVNFDSISLAEVGYYDEATATYDNTVKAISTGVTGVQNINARNPYNSTTAEYKNRPFLFVSLDLTNEAEAKSVLLNLMGITGGYGDIYVYQIEDCPSVGDQMKEGTLLYTIRINSSNTETVVTSDITDIYNSALGKKICLRIYGWYGNDKRAVSHMKLNADYLNITYSSVE